MVSLVEEFAMYNESMAVSTNEFNEANTYSYLSFIAYIRYKMNINHFGSFSVFLMRNKFMQGKQSRKLCSFTGEFTKSADNSTQCNTFKRGINDWRK